MLKQEAFTRNGQHRRARHKVFEALKFHSFHFRTDVLDPCLLCGHFQSAHTSFTPPGFGFQRSVYRPEFRNTHLDLRKCQPFDLRADLTHVENGCDVHWIHCYESQHASYWPFMDPRSP